jgi:predicted peptidase
MPQDALTIDHTMVQQLHLDYLRHLPSNFHKKAKTKWPLILFLHGAGERGDNVEQIKIHGIPKVAEQLDLPFVTLAPQCPLEHWWSDFLPALDALLTETIATMPIDPRRVYLTGMSMGGYGTWHMAAKYPQRFAAIAPICGGGPWMYGIYDHLDELHHIPAWVFHGAKDRVVPPRESKRLVKALTACGADVRFTLYPEAKHDSWTETYNNPELYTWFLSHQKGK